MEDLSVCGKIIHVLDKKTGTSAKSGNSWSIQQFVLETDEQYPKHVCFEVFGDDKLKEFNIKEGQQLKVYINLDAREWQGRWFNQLRAWKVEQITPREAIADNSKEAMARAEAAFTEKDEPDKLPF